MKDVLILGVDIHGLEMADIIRRGGLYHLVGYVRQEGSQAEGVFGEHPVVGGVDVLSQYPDAGFIPMHVWKSDAGSRQWVNLIDPSAFVASTAVLGRGCVVYPNCFIGAQAKLGNKIFVMSSSVINHDNIIGDGVTVTSGVRLAGFVKVGSGAYLGQGCNVRQYLSVGDNATVGMGAVVTKDVPAGVTVIGNPARPYVKKT